MEKKKLNLGDFIFLEAPKHDIRLLHYITTILF